MCRHEAAEALGALSDRDSLNLLEMIRDHEGEPGVVRETCEIAVERIKWDYLGRRGETIRNRYARQGKTCACGDVLMQ